MSNRKSRTKPLSNYQVDEMLGNDLFKLWFKLSPKKRNLKLRKADG